MKTPLTRRTFIGTATTAGVGASLWAPIAQAAEKGAQTLAKQPAAQPPVKWPRWDSHEEQALLQVLHSGRWNRTAGGTRIKEFESAFAEKMKARFCLATSSGTTALLTSLGALGIGPGDEVILPCYTFVATFNAITAHYALPVFVDSNPATFQIDPAKVAAAITPRTKLILPVHMGGSVADLDALANISRKHGIPMLEDACQAPLAEWRGQPVGTRGIGGCVSFQASKNLTAGEGGVVLTNDENFANLCYNFHTPGGGKPGASSGRAANFRLTEFQAGILSAQLARAEELARIREANAIYLDGLLRKIPGLTPARLTEGCTRSAYHFYMFHYDKKQFENLPRAKFLVALKSDGFPSTGGYKNMHGSPHVEALAANPHYQRIYGKGAMGRWLETPLPVNDRLCEEAVWLIQINLLGSRSDMDRLAESMARIRSRARELARG